LIVGQLALLLIVGGVLLVEGKMQGARLKAKYIFLGENI
jgi:hypothetical protein